MSQSAIRELLIATCLVVSGAVCVLGSSTPVVAQAPIGHSKVSLELGSVTVWLGMSQTDALLQFQSAGYKVSANGTTAKTSVEDENRVYSIWFKGGKVVCAEREWYSSGRDEIDAVLSALAAVASHGTSSCSILHDTINEPEQSAERVLIDCGERSVYLAKGKITSSTEIQYVSVVERIGQIP
jgi:hypothetical protein